MQNIYIIDGSGYIFRAYYAIQQTLTNSEGLPTNALYGFTKMLLGFLEKVTKGVEEPPIIVVVFDAARKNFRHDIYPEYKANRAECPEDLVPQMPYFRKVATALGFHILEKEGFEADDVIATIVEEQKQKNHKLIIVSADKDLTQLVSDRVEMWDPMRDKIFTEDEVLSHFGVKPSQIADYLSIVGDASDNIPGAKGVGPKTVAQLFQQFSNLDELLGNLDKVSQIQGLRGAKGVQAKLESNLELIRLSRELVKLNNTVPLENIESAWSGFRDNELKDLISELGFQSLFSRFSVSNSAKVKQDFSDKNYSIVSLSELKQQLNDQTLVSLGFDTETNSLDTLSANVVGISLSWDSNQGCYLPISENETDLQELRSLLNPILINPTIIKYGSNLKFDIRVLKSLGIDVDLPVFDTMIASQVLDPNSRAHGLKSLAKSLLQEEMVTYEDMMEGYQDINEVPLERLGRYAAHDADASFRIGKILEQKFEEDSYKSQHQLFNKIEMPVLPVLARMEQSGIKIDEDKLLDLEREFIDEVETLTTSILEHVGEDFNINSPKQLSVVLFEKMGLPTQGIKKTQSGYSTDAGVLQMLVDEHPVINELIEYREVHKLLTTYVQGFKKLIHPKTGRIHTSFNQAVTATGRLSSTDPNLQNIPIRSERGRKIRELFVAEEGSTFIISDYSQIELRILAHLSKDENFIQAFHSGEDIHLRTARELFGDMFAMGPTASEYRRIAKTINFGIIYGMGSFRLAGDLGVSRKEAQNFIDQYFSRYPKVKKYFDQIEEQVEKQGYIETLFGRRRYIEEVASKGRDKGYLVRSMMNMPIQGTAAEIVKLAMIEVDKKLKARTTTAKLLLQVHDELICEVGEGEAEMWQSEIKESMESVCKLLVPLKVEIISAKSWGDKK